MKSAGLTGSIYLFATELVVVLMIIRYNFKHKNSDWLFYASIAGGFAIAYPFAFLANRYLIARGRGGTDNGRWIECLGDDSRAEFNILGGVGQGATQAARQFAERKSG